MGPVIDFITKEPAKVGDRVQRIAINYPTPLGRIIEVDETRVRIQWDGGVRRWRRRDTERTSWRRVVGGEP